MIIILKYSALILGLLLACWQDIRYRKVSNFLTIPFLIYGLLLALPEGVAVLQDRFLAVLIAFVLCLPLYAMRALGAGDIKLLMALGAMLGCAWLKHILIWTILLGGIVVLFLMLWRGIFWNRLRYFFNYCCQTLMLRRFTVYQPWDGAEKMSEKHFFPFAVVIALGCLATWIEYKFFDLELLLV